MYPIRKHIRLREYDYSQEGAYFVTICVQNRECLFGEITDGVMTLSALGEIVREEWNGLTNHYSCMTLDAFVIMPNHVHGIILLHREELPSGDVKRKAELSELIRAFKSYSARKINEVRQSKGSPVWQKRYYDIVIRGDEMLTRAREYIINNPYKWCKDKENPVNN